jgi:signal transduction histidine kinase
MLLLVLFRLFLFVIILIYFFLLFLFLFSLFFILFISIFDNIHELFFHLFEVLLSAVLSNLPLITFILDRLLPYEILHLKDLQSIFKVFAKIYLLIFFLLNLDVNLQKMVEQEKLVHK